MYKRQTYDSSKIGTADVTVNPKVILYTLTFDSRGGSAIAPISDLIQGTAVELPAPLREGYQFDAGTQNRMEEPSLINLLL